MSSPIVVTVTDPETGETARKELQPGQYAVVCAEPRYLDGKQFYANGTVVLTLKRREPVMTREDAIKALTGRGKTREQAEAFLDVLGSAFRRRGWVAGDPLTYEQLTERLGTFLGDPGEPGRG